MAEIIPTRLIVFSVYLPLEKEEILVISSICDVIYKQFKSTLVGYLAEWLKELCDKLERENELMIINLLAKAGFSKDTQSSRISFFKSIDRRKAKQTIVRVQQSEIVKYASRKFVSQTPIFYNDWDISVIFGILFTQLFEKLKYRNWTLSYEDAE